MEFVIINAIMYTATLLIYWIYRRQVDLGFIILAAFTIIAILGIPNHYFLGSLYKRSISMLPFIYLFIIILLFIRPYLNANLSKKIKAHSLKKLELIVYLFIISSFFSILTLLPQAIENIQSGEWRDVRNELYAQEKKALYSSLLERIFLVFNQYFRLISILILFYFISLQKHSKTLIILLGVLCFIPTFLMSVVNSSRGAMVNLFMEFGIGYYLFKNQIPASVKKIFYFSFIMVLSVFLIYSIAVTDSRFGEDTNYSYSSNLSLIDYFGQPMLVFNDGVASMHDYANGKYFFKLLLDSLNIDSDINQYQLGGNWGVSFFTFIGAFYIDIGPIGTFFLALILPYLITKNINGHVIYFENLYLYYFFYMFFLEGVFVTGYSSFITWLFALFIYLFLKTTRTNV